jgi:hypothetical protein
VGEALRNLGYAPEQLEHIIAHIEKHDTIEDVALNKGDEAVKQGLSQEGDIYGGFKKVCAFNQQHIGGSRTSGRDWARASERVRKGEKGA